MTLKLSPRKEAEQKSLAALNIMDVVLAVQQYVARMTEGVSGMKALLLDKEVCNGWGGLECQQNVEEF